MLTLQPQHAFRRQSASHHPHLSMPRRPPTRVRSTQPSPPSTNTPSTPKNGVLSIQSGNSGTPGMSQPTTPPFFLKPLPAELPAILLAPCLTPDKFVAVCGDPAILADLVDHIQSIHDFLSFTYVSKEMRAVVGAAFEKDAVVRHRFFARFLPGHSLVSRPYWNPRLRIDFTDLELFREYLFRSIALRLDAYHNSAVESEAVPLSTYPMHALMLMASTSPPSPERHEMTMRFQTLTLTHSRFILYLRARSSLSISQDEDERVQTPPLPVMKELNFPQPLSYPSLNTSPLVPLHRPLTQSAATDASTKGRVRRRLSIVPKKAQSLPPPPAPRISPPPTLFGSRRLSRLSRSTPKITQSTFESPLSPPSSFSYAHRRSHSAQDASAGTRSSDGQLVGRSRSTPQVDTLQSASRGGSALSIAAAQQHGSVDSFPGATTASSLHSLSRVWWQARAPILRVFVPCSVLDEATLHACMVQLTAAELHKHLAPGDLVINFGYVPEQAEGAEEDVGWMIYDGERLMPLTHRIPVYNPTFTLPSPFYYSHVLPPTQNPRFVLTIPRRPTQAPTFTHARVSSTVASVMSPTGRVRVNMNVWMSRIDGLRWGSDWTLEAEGTKEGKAFLEAAIAGGEHEWELIREKSGRGRIWLRRVLR